MAYKILIIDDDTELLKMLKRYFEMRKYEIITAENGAEGLSKIKLKPDIILLDVNMPKIDGIQVCRRIRDKVACPVLFLTARVDEQDVVNGLSSGGDDYILKPFSLKELDARIQAHLKREARRKERTNCCFQGELSIDYRAKTVQIGADYLELTKLEYEIIEFLSMNPGMVFEKERILLYMAAALLFSFVLSAAIVRIAEQTQTKVWWNYVDEDTYFKAVEREGPDYVADIPRPSSYEMTKPDHFVSELCDFLQTYAVLVLSMSFSCGAVFLFYQNKLRHPIEELKDASKRIAENHLDFHISYENEDEMGVLCKEFERMRSELAKNNQILWRMVEEEKMLRAAIAHDMRAPLTVLKGYQEMLADCLQGADADTAQAMDMLSESGRQIARMDAFVETMRKMSSLESRKPRPEEILAGQLKEDIQAELAVLEKEYGKQCVLQVTESEEIFCGDKEMILEVTENLLSNALRYGKKQIEIAVKTGHSELTICVRDDGGGFQEDAEKLTRAFYGQNIKDSLKHAGMGMYISRLYCEKHGGKLLLENDEQGGAAVTAIFCRIV